MRRQELWERNYLRCRYLEGASREALVDRLRITMENHTTLTTSGQIGLVEPKLGGLLWLELATHVHVELALRNMKEPPPNFLAQAAIPHPTYPSAPSAVAALSKLSISNPKNIIAKLGRRAHMEAFFSEGRLRISPASSYSDPSLNAAIRDDELSVSIAVPMREMQLHSLESGTGQKTLLEARADGEITWTASTNYYVFCASRALDLRLFSDFGYDACVVITEPMEFFARLNSAMRRHLPDWDMHFEEVRYVDPYHPPEKGPSVYFDKHFRYWYQHEHRSIWVPPRKFCGAFTPITVTMGPLEDIAQLALLDPS